MPEQETTVARAVDRVLRRLDQPRELDAQGGRVIGRPRPGGVVGVTAEGRDAVAHAARVEPDPVIGGADIARNESAEHAVDQPGPSRTSGVDEHDPLVVLVGRCVHHPRDRELDLRAGRSRVVERHAEHPALSPERDQRGACARAPRDAAHLRAGARDLLRRCSGGVRGHKRRDDPEHDPDRNQPTSHGSSPRSSWRAETDRLAVAGTTPL